MRSVCSNVMRRCSAASRAFTWFIYRIHQPAMRNLFMNPRNILRLQEAVLAMLSGDVFGSSPVHARLTIFKAPAPSAGTELQTTASSMALIRPLSPAPARQARRALGRSVGIPVASPGRPGGLRIPDGSAGIPGWTASGAAGQAVSAARSRAGTPPPRAPGLRHRSDRVAGTGRPLPGAGHAVQRWAGQRRGLERQRRQAAGQANGDRDARIHGQHSGRRDRRLPAGRLLRLGSVPGHVRPARTRSAA